MLHYITMVFCNLHCIYNSLFCCIVIALWHFCIVFVVQPLSSVYVPIVQLYAIEQYYILRTNNSQYEPP